MVAASRSREAATAPLTDFEDDKEEDFLRDNSRRTADVLEAIEVDDALLSVVGLLPLLPSSRNESEADIASFIFVAVVAVDAAESQGGEGGGGPRTLSGVRGADDFEEVKVLGGMVRVGKGVGSGKRGGVGSGGGSSSRLSISCKRVAGRVGCDN